MASFQIRWRDSALGELNRLDRSVVPTIISHVEALADDPFPPQSLKLKGRENQRRLRVRDYRVLYEVDTQNHTIWIAAVGPRGSIYR